MPQATFHFPAGFLWGTATAAHQVEGNNTLNNWWAWEQQPGHIHQDQKSGIACDWWGANGIPRWREDFDRAAQTGQNAHRFSIEWSRIQPTPDHWDEHALDVYREMARYLTEQGLTPMVTLHHFTDPLWLTEQNGWESPAAIEKFVAFTRKAVEALREYVHLWITFNEPNVYMLGGYSDASFPPGKHDLKLGFYVMENMVKAHAAAYRAIHDLQPQAQVGIATHYRGFQPYLPWPVDNALAKLLHNNFNTPFVNALRDGRFNSIFRRTHIPEAKGTQDFIGLNYYTRDLVTFDLFKPGELFNRRFFRKNAELSETGMIANEPQGLTQAIKWSLGFKIPIIITENGVEDSHDTLRPKYLIQHLYQVWHAVNLCYPVKGYFHWSLVDNFEWERGWTQRFGLWAVDETTQIRRKRPSADLYAEICKENGISSEMVAKYAPDLLPVLFPG